MGALTNIFILTWKNFKLDIRHPWRTAVVVMTPVICIFLLIIFRLNAGSDIKEIETVFDPYDINTLPTEEFNSSDTYSIYYTPKSAFIDKVMKEVASYLNVSSIGFENEDKLIFSYMDSHSKVAAAVIFHPNLKNGPTNYGPIEYTIRPQKILGIPWNLSSIGPPVPVIDLTDKSMYGTHYMNYGFLAVQHAIAKTLMDNFFPSLEKKFDDMFVIEMRRQPYPRYEVDSFYESPDYFITAAIYVGFLIPSIIIAKSIVHEKQTHMKDILITMGISNRENWMAWFIKDFLLLSFCCLIMSAMLCIKFGEHAVMDKSDASLILLWLILYVTSIIAFTFFITTLFDDENSAAAATCVLYILTLLPYIHGNTLFSDVPMYAMWIICLLPNSLFAYSVGAVLGLELFGEGLRWSTMYKIIKSHGKLNMYFVFVMLIIDILVYFILTWYIEVMRPGPFQTHYPWYFPLMGTYWTGNKNIPPVTSLYEYHHVNPDYFERDPSKVKPMIDIRNLTKAYGKHTKPVIDQVDLRAYKGQLTVLLGANSSGKTTFASMLYGALCPTAGTIYLKGFNMCKSSDAQKVTPLLGICPNFNISIDELNVEENIYFFCRIKGYDTGLEAEISHILGMFDLEIQKRRLVSSLAVITKRRLSVGIALAGESEIVILDEPTLHMDSYSRRITWDVLHLEKKDRAIFLTTSHIEEANMLADKIVVLQNGHIKCSGSPSFLKNKYGAGYILIISKETECRSVVIKNLIFSKIPDAVVINDTEKELKVMLPHDSCKSYHLLFKEFEDRADLKIKDVFITETTLDELFERISGRSLKSSNQELKLFKKEDSVFHYFTRKRNEGFTLFCQHVKALLKKKYLYSSRRIFLTAALIIILPCIIAVSSLLRERQKFDRQKFINESIFNLKGFGTTNVIYGIDPSSNVTISLGDTYASLLDSENLYLVDLEEENYLAYIIKQAEKNLITYKTKYIIGAVFTERFNKNVITAYYNGDAYHSAPTSLQYVHNTILKHFTKESSFYFEVKNHPLPDRGIEEIAWSSDFNLAESFLWAQDFMTGISILMSSFIVLLVIESSTKSKMQQIISGLNAFVYWFATFIYDFSLYIFSCLLTLLILSMLETECLSQSGDISFLTYLFLLHGLSALLFIYCCSFCTKSSSVAYMGIFLYYFLGLFFLCIVYRLEHARMYHVSEPLNIVFTIFMPSYCVGRGIYNIHRNCKTNYICNNNITQIRCIFGNVSSSSPAGACCLDSCEDYCLFWSLDHSSLSVSGTGKQLIALIIQPLVFCMILILFELEIIQNLKQHITERQFVYYNESSFSIDKSVQEETDKISTSPLPKLFDEQFCLVLKNALKRSPRYPIGKFSFGVKRGKCFGLLGIDKAGKSTVLNMISGNTPISKGNIFIDGYSILEYPNKVQDKIGFSFGNPALLKQLTVKETLTLYSRIKGIPENKIPYFIEILTNMLSLNCHLLIKNCSIVSRRKICVAIAIIGTPPLILLDEPTDDMDPESLMSTRQVLKHALGVGCTIMLAACRIDECQALCDRIGILVKGKLTYLGNFDHLKSQYADGFTLILRIIKSRQERSRHTRQAINLKGNLEEIKGIIEDALPQAILKMEYITFLNYYVPERKVTWSKLFRLLEKMKFQDMISSYTICETNLEYIFAYYVACADELKDTKIAEFLKARRKESV